MTTTARVFEPVREDEMVERFWHIERMLRDALKATRDPIVDYHIRQAIYWLEQVKR